jgi:hypothetical protein
MNLTNKVLKLLGMKLASEIMTTDVCHEVRLWRAVIALALEDVLNTSQGRNESVIKAEAHDWFINSSDDFDRVCFNAGLDADWVRDRYIRALDTGLVRFTQKQHLNVRYTKVYEKLRKEKNKDARKKLQKVVEKMRRELLES